MIASAEATAYLCFCIGWNGGYLPVYLRGSSAPSTWLPARGVGARMVRLVQRWDQRDSAQVELGLPESKRDNGGPGACTVLWCWLRHKESVQRAARFSPAPSIVLRMGSSCHRLLLWPLRQPLPYGEAAVANRKLAYALHAPQTMAPPDKLRLPLPGTFLRAGRVRPAPVLVTKLDVIPAHALAEVVGGLRPAPKSWAQRQRESGAWR